MTNHSDFGGDTVQDLDPGLLNLESNFWTHILVREF